MKENLYRLAGQWLTSEEAKEAREKMRGRILVWAGGLCLFVLFLLAVIWPLRAHADTRKFENRMATVRFLDTPCELDVKGKEAMRSAHGDFTMLARTPYGMYPMGRQEFKGCWKRSEAGYESVWEDGQEITFPAAEVQPEGV